MQDAQYQLCGEISNIRIAREETWNSFFLVLNFYEYGKAFATCRKRHQSYKLDQNEIYDALESKGSMWNART